MDNLELLPEPEEPRMMTTIDPDAPGYPGEVYGVSDEEARELRSPAFPLREILWPWGAITFAFGATFMLLVWPHINAYLAPVLPETEWAYESTGYGSFRTRDWTDREFTFAWSTLESTPRIRTSPI